MYLYILYIMIVRHGIPLNGGECHYINSKSACICQSEKLGGGLLTMTRLPGYHGVMIEKVQ